MIILGDTHDESISPSLIDLPGWLEVVNGCCNSFTPFRGAKDSIGFAQVAWRVTLKSKSVRFFSRLFVPLVTHHIYAISSSSRYAFSGLISIFFSNSSRLTSPFVCQAGVDASAREDSADNDYANSAVKEIGILLRRQV